MRLKDYLRGLGMGMIVVVLILTIAGRDRTMTDDEIIARARQLGMVDGNQTLTHIKDTESASREDTSEEDTTSESNEGSVAETTDTSEEEETGESAETDESQEFTEPTETAESQESTESTETDETISSTGTDEVEESSNETSVAVDSDKATPESTTITVTVQRGDSSVSVSRDLAASGAVDNAKEFDQYLCSNGYDKRICVGTFEITLGASYEEIAKIITKSK